MAIVNWFSKVSFFNFRAAANSSISRRQRASHNSTKLRYWSVLLPIEEQIYNGAESFQGRRSSKQRWVSLWSYIGSFHYQRCIHRGESSVDFVPFPLIKTICWAPTPSHSPVWNRGDASFVLLEGGLHEAKLCYRCNNMRRIRWKSCLCVDPRCATIDDWYSSMRCVRKGFFWILPE